MNERDLQRLQVRDEDWQRRLSRLRAAAFVCVEIAFMAGVFLASKDGPGIVMLASAAYEYGRHDQKLHDTALVMGRVAALDHERGAAWTTCASNGRTCPRYEFALERHMEAGAIATAIRQGKYVGAVESLIPGYPHSCDRLREFYGRLFSQATP